MIDSEMSGAEAQLFRLLTGLLSPAGERARLLVLIYHRMPAVPDPMLPDEIDASTFMLHLRLLGEACNVLPLGEACARLVRGTLPSCAACITFDDGYADNEQVALPILKRLGLAATFFVATGYCDGQIMFNDGVIETLRRAPAGTYDLSDLGLGFHTIDGIDSRRRAVNALVGALKYRHFDERSSLVERLAEAMHVALPRNLMMNSAQIRRLHDVGMEIGAHTVSHPILSTLDRQRARVEIVEGKRRLEDITGRRIALFAYPNGKPGRDYGPEHVRLVREAGFDAAVSTTAGIAHSGSDIFQLPRLGSWDRSGWRLGLRILKTYVQFRSTRRSALSISRSRM